MPQQLAIIGISDAAGRSTAARARLPRLTQALT